MNAGLSVYGAGPALLLDQVVNTISEYAVGLGFNFGESGQTLPMLAYFSFLPQHRELSSMGAACVM